MRLINLLGKIRWGYRCSDVGTKRSTRQVSNIENSAIVIDCMFAITSGPLLRIHAIKEMDLQGLEDVPDFWNIDLDDDNLNEEITPQVLDFASHRGRFTIPGGH